MKPIAERAKLRRTHAFVTPHTLDLLAEKMIGVIADRRMVLMRRRVGRDRGEATPELELNVRVSRLCIGAAVRWFSHESVAISLERDGHPCLPRLAFGVPPHCADESEVADRYWHPENHWLGQRRDIVRVALDGFPGQSCRDDRVLIARWNEHGVGEEVVAVFDDTDPAQLIADEQRVIPAGQLFDNHYCTAHGYPYDHPEHPRGFRCETRPSTRAEDLDALGALIVRGPVREEADQ